MIEEQEINNAFTNVKDTRENLAKAFEFFVKAEIEFRDCADPLYAGLQGKNEAARTAELNSLIPDTLHALDDAKATVDHAKMLYDLAKWECERVQATIALLQIGNK